MKRLIILPLLCLFCSAALSNVEKPLPTEKKGLVELVSDISNIYDQAENPPDENNKSKPTTEKIINTTKSKDTKKTAINKPAPDKGEIKKPAPNKTAPNEVKTKKPVAKKAVTRKKPKFTRLTKPIKINSLSAQDQIFENVVIEERSDKGVMVMHKNGASFIKKDSLPDDLKKEIYK
jgi:hypothetical protein